MEKLDKVKSFELSEWDIIQVSGPDSVVFLQNLLTIDVEKLLPCIGLAFGSDNLKLGGFCSPQGRLIASFWISRQSIEGIDTFNIWISRDIAKDLATKLSRFIFRSKVKIHHTEDKFSIFGSLSENISNVISDENNLPSLEIRLPDVKFHEKSFKRIMKAIPKITVENSPDSLHGLHLWNKLEIQSGIPRIVTKTQGLFVPQMINFESIGGIDFKKGCYPGQEVVARSQYRGTIKRRLKLAEIEITSENQIPQPGDEVFNPINLEQPVGVVILSSFDHEIKNSSIQVELKLEELDSQLIVKTQSGYSSSLKIKDTPYPLLEI